MRSTSSKYKHTHDICLFATITSDKNKKTKIPNTIALSNWCGQYINSQRKYTKVRTKKINGKKVSFLFWPLADITLTINYSKN